MTSELFDLEFTINSILLYEDLGFSGKYDTSKKEKIEVLFKNLGFTESKLAIPEQEIISDFLKKVSNYKIYFNEKYENCIVVIGNRKNRSREILIRVFSPRELD